VAVAAESDGNNALVAEAVLLAGISAKVKIVVATAELVVIRPDSLVTISMLFVRSVEEELPSIVNAELT
jgi:hypothetical protein